MKRSLWGKLGRVLTSSLLGSTIILGSALTAQADEAQMPVPDISPWSIGTLHEGEKYGIFPLDWYYDGTFQQAITADKFQSLLEDTAAKLDKLGLSKQGELELPSLAEAAMTRETVVLSLHALLAQYELPEAFEFDKSTPVEYLQHKGIIEGTGRGLELEQPCTVEQAAVLASRLVEYTYDTVQGGAQGLFWKATHGDNTLYLLGSIHLGSPEMYPVDKEVRDAFAASDDLWVEVNMVTEDPEPLNYFTQLTVYNDGTTLKNHVSQETYEKLQEVNELLGLHANAFDTFKPWVVTNNLSLFSLSNTTENLALAQALGVDLYFLQSALLTGKPIHELEGFKLQGDLFNNIAPEVQEEELNQALDAILNPSEDDDTAEQFRLWQQYWAQGDLDSFAESFLNSADVKSESAQRLFGERDTNMAKKLAELLEQEGENTSFVVVGAGHFVIEGLIIDQLKDKGYTVEFIQ
ncbi:TraB/GumN family protein [Paenibacillus sp. J2TS4]|uniref:TraB/GumN family protein n=1 Tax=Paenibacillus sp. J2TS4 TaxID=2807194 RepID=UPI001B004CB8|nr:TraB/GumN family protein [Paenibacillus sp. J2TS4]GIP34908.1 hypothetical protein J2TS4_41180 [Paenibacillus sp. J2TS4]